MALRAGADTYPGASDRLRQLGAQLQGAVQGTQGASWSGLGATAFENAGLQLAGVFGRAHAALAEGSSALAAYSGALAAAQATATRAQAAVDGANATAQAVAGQQAAATQAATAASAPTAGPGLVAAALSAAAQLTALEDQLAAEQALAIRLADLVATQAQQATQAAAAAFDAVATLATGPHRATGLAGLLHAVGQGVHSAAAPVGNVLTLLGVIGLKDLGPAEVAVLRNWIQLPGARQAVASAIGDLRGTVVNGTVTDVSSYMDAVQAYKLSRSTLATTADAVAKNTAAVQDAAGLPSSLSTVAEDAGAASPGLLGGVMGVVGKVALPVGVALSAYSLFHPGQHGAWRVGNEVTAGANLVGLALLVTPGLEPVGGVILVGTTVYSAVDLVAHNWGAISSATDQALVVAQHAEVQVAQAAWHGAEHAATTVARDASHLASSAWHDAGQAAAALNPFNW